MKRPRDGWYFNPSTQEFIQYASGTVVERVIREAWTDYWLMNFQQRGRYIYPWEME